MPFTVNRDRASESGSSVQRELATVARAAIRSSVRVVGAVAAFGIVVAATPALLVYGWLLDRSEDQS